MLRVHYALETTGHGPRDLLRVPLHHSQRIHRRRTSGVRSAGDDTFGWKTRALDPGKQVEPEEIELKDLSTGEAPPRVEEWLVFGMFETMGSLCPSPLTGEDVQRHHRGLHRGKGGLMFPK